MRLRYWPMRHDDTVQCYLKKVTLRGATPQNFIIFTSSWKNVIGNSSTNLVMTVLNRCT